MHPSKDEPEKNAPTTPSSSTPETRLDAQRRADRIRAFQAELETLERDGVLTLTADQQDRVTRHHAARLASLRQAFDVDSDETTRQMSRSMQAAALLGAVAFSAALVSFFLHYWGLLSTPLQVVTLASAPLLALAGVELAARRERTQYVASLLALVACVAVVTEVSVLGLVFNMRSSPNAVLGCAAFALALGYGYGFRLPYAGGLLGLMAYVTGATAAMRGLYWTEGIRTDEVLLLTVGALLLLPRLHARWLAPWRAALLDPVARGVPAGIGLFALLALTINGGWSLLPLASARIALLYEILALPVAIATIVVGLRRRQLALYVLGVIFLLLFLLGRFVDWWWDWMPSYVFFLLLGATTLTLLAVLRRARRTLMARGRA